jgi:hypothetical protein
LSRGVGKYDKVMGRFIPNDETDLMQESDESGQYIKDENSEHSFLLKDIFPLYKQLDNDILFNVDGGGEFGPLKAMIINIVSRQIKEQKLLPSSILLNTIDELDAKVRKMNPRREEQLNLRIRTLQELVNKYGNLENQIQRSYRN